MIEGMEVVLPSQNEAHETEIRLTPRIVASLEGASLSTGDLAILACVPRYSPIDALRTVPVSELLRLLNGGGDATGDLGDVGGIMGGSIS